ncbi:MAG: Fic family protein [Clostridiales bacterium]|nr:Fic family protein [Clostridiales bacterium]
MMFREIKKKQLILENRKPYSSEVCKYIREMDMADWIHSSMRLDGSVLSRHDVETILKGELVAEASLSEHLLVEKYSSLFKAVQSSLAISSSLSREMIFSFHRMLAGEGATCYRKGNPVLLAINYNPPHPSEIEEQMDILMGWFYSADMEPDPITKAVCLHHRIIEIYPFDEHTEAVARAAMYYFLLENRYPVFEISMSEQEYNRALMEYLKKENLQPFCLEVERSLLNKMELLIQLTAQQN